jgi:hypothetical protein
MLLGRKNSGRKWVIHLAILSSMILSFCGVSYAITDQQYLDVYFGMAQKFYNGDAAIKAPFLDIIRHYLMHGDINEDMNVAGKYSGKTIGEIIQGETQSCPMQKSVDGVDCCWGTNTGADCFENRCRNGLMYVYSCSAGQCVAPNPTACTCDSSEEALYGHSHKCA